jgi:hypothetical protein
MVGIHRTVRKAVVEANNGKYDKYIHVKYQRWAYRWQWELRAAAWDKWQAEQLSEKISVLKATTLYKGTENLYRLHELNSKILSGDMDQQSQQALEVLVSSRQSDTLDQATKLHGVLFGNKQEIKGQMDINLAHAILSADPKTIDI